MKFVGFVTKLKIVDSVPVNYFFQVGEHSVPLNDLIGQEVSLRFTGQINCIACKRRVSKSYQQGYCFPCTQKLAQCDLCILKPELCHFAKGTCREPSWGEQNCNIPHIVYLANTSGSKVGITKAHNMLTRWFDQGAIQALPLLQIQSRHHSGLIEVELAKSIPDKTNWRKMLQKNLEPIDLIALREQILNTYSFAEHEILNAAVKEIVYPGEEYPKAVALNFKEQSIIKGKLMGLKGQYMLFAHGVLNIRNLTGYEIEIEY